MTAYQRCNHPGHPCPRLYQAGPPEEVESWPPVKIAAFVAVATGFIYAVVILGAVTW